MSTDLRFIDVSKLYEDKYFLKNILITWLLIILSTTGFTQSFRGSIRDNKTKENLPYANIGIKKKSIGGITDQNGTFQVDLSQSTKLDTVVISYIGYTSIMLAISKLDLNQYHFINLEPSAQMLREVIIRSKPEIITLGNKSRTPRHTGWGDFSSSRGRAIGLLVKVPDFSVRINKLFFHLDANEFDSVRVRINFLMIEDKELKPFESQKKNIFLTIHKRKGWIEVPLFEDIILRKENVVVAIEWVDAWAKQRSMEEGGSYLFTLSLAKSSGSHYIRQKPDESIQLANSESTPSIYLECFAVRD
jgi:CarboxypepD_reg-like domain